jgi:hypothetical protein
MFIVTLFISIITFLAKRLPPPPPLTEGYTLPQQWKVHEKIEHKRAINE